MSLHSVRAVIFTSALLAGGLSAQQFQLNQPAASMTIGGTTATASTPAVTTVAQGTMVQVDLDTSVGFIPFEMAISARPAVGANTGGLPTAGGQIVNVDLLDPSLLYLSTGTQSPGFALTFPGNRLRLPFTVPTALNALTLTGQMATLDPSHPDGMRLSQACQIDGRVDWGGYPYNASNLACPSHVQPVTLANDGVAQLNLQAPLSYYGTSYTQVFVHANGHVTLGSAGPMGTVADETWFDLAAPMIVPMGADLDPSSGGSVAIGSLGPTFDVCFTNVPHATLGGSNTFRLQVNPGGIFTFYGPNVSFTEGLVGFSAGGGVNAKRRVNWSWLGGPNGPESYRDAMGNPVSAFQTFTAAEPFDIVGNQLIWLFDGTGTPNTSP